MTPYCRDDGKPCIDDLCWMTGRRLCGDWTYLDADEPVDEWWPDEDEDAS